MGRIIIPKPLTFIEHRAAAFDAFDKRGEKRYPTRTAYLANFALSGAPLEEITTLWMYV